MNFLGKEIGKGKPTFIIAEAGINHQGQLAKAKSMVEVARGAGADAIKFQKRDMDELYRMETLSNPSKESHSLGVYIPILKQCELSEIDHAQLKEYCDELGIKYLCSPWDIPSVQFLEGLNVDGYKVPSACLSDTFLMNEIYQTGKPAIFSTGMHEESEMLMLLNKAMRLFGDEKMAILHCVSSYPTANRDVNLKYMVELLELFNCPVGYSGHERGLPITVAAVALGAQIIERHFTLDRTLPGPDHAASIEPHGLETLVRHIRAIEDALGGEKAVNQGETVARETLGKVLTWAKDHKAGEPLTKASLKSTSPGYGLPVWMGEKLINDSRIVNEPVVIGKPVFKNQLKKREEVNV